jgi:hypothetical protein
MAEVNVNSDHSSLLLYGNIYCRKKIFNSGPEFGRTLRAPARQCYVCQCFEIVDLIFKTLKKTFNQTLGKNDVYCGTSLKWLLGPLLFTFFIASYK